MLTLENAGALRQMLRSAGVTNVNTAQAYLEALEKLQVLPADLQLLLADLAQAASPETALLTALKIAETQPELLKNVLGNEEQRQFFIRICGSSDMFADYLVSHAAVLEAQLPSQFAEHLDSLPSWLETLAVQQGLDLTSVDGLRSAYWQSLLCIAGMDLAGTEVATISQLLSQLVDATLVKALDSALGKISCPGMRFAVIAMGKTGAQELNYISDVDLLYVYEPAAQMSEAEGLQYASQVAAQIGMLVSGPGSLPPLWPIDLGLRPEGKDGAIARTLDSYRAYYAKWAQNWEFQALLKARAVAGDPRLGQAFIELVNPLVWGVAGKPQFVADVRQMRQTVEANIPRKDMERQLKLGRGGLRDIEFSVQLLQLVHGRTDESLRVAGTFAAIAALAAGGYVGREAAQGLSECYRFLRLLEHRAQLLKMRRTHLVPTQPAVLNRLARSLRTHYPQLSDGQSLEAYWQEIKQRVRALHEAIFYRPLVETIAQVSSELQLMSESSVLDRLAAFGYRDPQGTLQHARALTVGTTRTAMIQRQIMPAMFAWLADGADPDQGMLNFRKLSEEIGASHWYLGLLRDSTGAAQRLCRILPTSTYATHALMKLPEAVKWLDDDRQLQPLPRQQVWSQARAILDRYEYSVAAVERLRAFRDRELTRAALADLVLGISQGRCALTITAITDAAISGAIEVARRSLGITDTFVYAVAMGRFGGGELTYGSDADVICFHSGELSEAEAIVKKTVSLLNSVSESGALNLDLDLRPEGKNGSLSKTLEGYREYWQKWAAPWERHALVRARVIPSLNGGAEETENRVKVSAETRFQATVTEFVYGNGLSAEELKQIRLLKARMETERIPRGVASTQHLKLGPGGLTDVEWLVQVKQLQLGFEHLQLRTPNTLEALEQLVKLGEVAEKDAQLLRTAWLGASHLRAANVLATDRVRARDLLPRQVETARMVALVLGHSPDEWQLVNDQLLKSARQARKVFENYFYV
ncbi:bifunctional [glutamine synthetase] adenylyltransferase/[glutamine synthetase]-adenylyl-L-tyrosine phosphorylase [Gleimia sp. 6138-11-ORH1]|uniref:bifunctional [glutamine synthetase] adenylyltransferase/[glutamine synthetase]-adenylyl-L-tyrosine phosphorylase n=1 Tax=Gleimia sp. 6138-11-ORH1 TaxID=2973937 RepID=UPI002167990C|nr:bifunctional [glutamine synthetase] adenylyltransferase/[glutamine synthetase]-adenylyl-L-tyrosine phosphorylase [Gleimia sp. 6138-11-ORH1]MCS4484257.1 bifunctional [glutamine synthetase] adenylyltransferase/[glutamine synthetase]-adenylyl-L-tyrosine phosphorylase [Gleimia sp. 6138-11-ORH1]